MVGDTLMRTIKEGDRVSIWFGATAPMPNVIVDHVPEATGDPWYVHDKKGDCYAINHFEIMKKIEE
jgi:hypothetical protein